MRSISRMRVSLMTIAITVGVMLVPAAALEYGDYANTWYAIKCAFTGVCDFDDAEELKQDGHKEKGWIFIENSDSEYIDASLFTMDMSGAWQKTEFSLRTHLGTASDALLELETPIYIADATTGDETTVHYLFIRLTGKGKKAGISSAKLGTVEGMAVIELVDATSCRGSMKFKGTLAKESKVPDEVKAQISNH